jgi:hypothetical protein
MEEVELYEKHSKTAHDAHIEGEDVSEFETKLGIQNASNNNCNYARSAKDVEIKEDVTFEILHLGRE